MGRVRKLSKTEKYVSGEFPIKRVKTVNDYAQLPDRSVWEAFKEGDELAFVNIYRTYVDVLFNYGCQFTADREMVKDCLQDFFVYLRNSRAGLGKTDNIKLYLLKAFRRRVFDYLKKTNREIQHNEYFAFLQFPIELSSESMYINRQIEAEQLVRLNTALQALNTKEREAIYYFYYEGLSYEQIAEILHVTHVSSARRIVYRGLSHLKKFF
ncbi:RNA polymerase sigma factor [Parapedobacter koreensis]|uniref:RNA polymerase sigma-70 factor, ECF subfamily n=1 Tax=Parapedobacter koreensis TaxID=332977 RepID=A0A1H7L292_9SPHI|nr:sigma-70 family RNA polymerase sigma factor [Parapedobacter koreensis]SEK92944.1 RNA polymerase sigma-70 factor, ECF subfamily [Parapedobacter koreensis]